MRCQESWPAVLETKEAQVEVEEVEELAGPVGVGLPARVGGGIEHLDAGCPPCARFQALAHGSHRLPGRR